MTADTDLAGLQRAATRTPPGAAVEWTEQVAPGPGSWEPVTEPPGLQRDEVHVWRARLDPSPGQLEHMDWLDPQERRRAARFRFRPDRDRFVAAHLALRGVLARYLGEQPDRLRFAPGRHGKPALAGREAPLVFNLAHSHAYALIAISRAREVGVDIEQIRPELVDDTLIRQLFTPRERSAWMAPGPEARTTAFFNWWTRREAYGKARGLGLALDSDSFSVVLAPDPPAQHLFHSVELGNDTPWLLHDLCPGPGYAGAVVARGDSWRLRRLEWLWPVWEADVQPR